MVAPSIAIFRGNDSAISSQAVAVSLNALPASHPALHALVAVAVAERTLGHLNIQPAPPKNHIASTGFDITASAIASDVEYESVASFIALVNVTSCHS